MGNVREKVHEAFEAVKETMADTMKSVKNTAGDAATAVKHFDAREMLERHPWLYIGGVMTLGYLAYRLLEQARPPQTGIRPTPEPHHGNGKHREEEQGAPSRLESAAEGARRPEDWAELTAELKALAVGVPLCIIRDKLAAKGADAFRSQVNEVMNALTEKLGGRVIEQRTADT